MKVNLKEEGIRKALDCIPADSQDPDLQQLRDTLEKRLDDVQANDQQLTVQELDAIVVSIEKGQIQFNVRPQLVTALPKLRVMLSKTMLRDGQ